MKNSGWFKPTVESVLCRKASLHLPVFKTMTTGVYLFKHKFKENTKYVGKSQALYSGRDVGKILFVTNYSPYNYTDIMFNFWK